MEAAAGASSAATTTRPAETAVSPPPVPEPAAAAQPTVPAQAPSAEPSRPAQRESILRPEPELPQRTPVAPAAPPRKYTGPSSGTLVWSGPLRRDALITIEGDRASEGTLQGSLPGVPVLIETDFRDIGFAEMPSPSNGWKRLSFRGRRNQNVVVVLRWRVLE